MTDLPKVEKKKEVDASWWLTIADVDNPEYVERVATLEDVRQVLDAAGYVVEEKQNAAPRTRELINTTERMGYLASAVREGLANADWDKIREGLLEYDGIKTSGAPAAALVDSEEGGVAPRPAGGREEPGTVVPDFGQPKKVLEVRFPLGGTPRRATFADLHELEKEHWISLRPCSECEYGPVNDKICTTCFELVEAKLAELQVRHTNLLMKLGEKLSEMSAADLIKMVSDGATVGAAKLHEQVRDLAAKVVALDHIAKDAIAGMRLVGHGCAADVLQERLDALK